MKLLGISGSMQPNNRTRTLVSAVLQAAKARQDSVETELLDLSEYNVQFCDARNPSAYEGDTRTVIDKVMAADAYVIGTPIYQGSLSGSLKNLFDLVPPAVFRNKVIGCAANGGTYQHFLVIENQIKPILGYFHAYVTPGYIYAHNQHYNEKKEISDVEILTRIDLLAAEIVTMHEKLRGLAAEETAVMNDKLQ
jgi:FAD reductase [NAD(P)H]